VFSSSTSISVHFSLLENGIGLAVTCRTSRLLSGVCCPTFLMLHHLQGAAAGTV
jgi:hypothetical protein